MAASAATDQLITPACGRRPARSQRPAMPCTEAELTSAYPKSDVNAEGIPALTPQRGGDPRNEQWGTRLWRRIDATNSMIHPH